MSPASRQIQSEIVVCAGGSSFVLLFSKVNYISFTLNPYIIQQTRIAITVDFLPVAGDGELLISEDWGWEESFVCSLTSHFLSALGTETG